MEPYYYQEDDKSIEKMSPLFSIWIKPKKTFEYLSNLDYVVLCNKLDITLLFISISVILQSILRDFDKTQNLGLGYMTIMGIIGLAFGFLFIKYGFAYILLLFSRLFQGKADITGIRIALIYSLVPQLLNLIISIGLIITSVITKNIKILDYQNMLTYIILSLISLSILVIGLSYYNKYSYGYGIMTILIPVGIVQLIIYFLAK